MAIVIALAIVLVVFLLITAVVSQAMYDVSQAMSARRRTEAINAAEAGIGWYAQFVDSATVPDLVDLPWVNSAGTYSLTQAGGLPGVASADAFNAGGLATFRIEAKYFSALPCPQPAVGAAVSGCSMSGAPIVASWPTTLSSPIWAIVRSTGRSAGFERTMETVMKLTPVTGTPNSQQGLNFRCVKFDGQPKVTITGKVQIFGWTNGPCAGYPNGLLMATSGWWDQTGDLGVYGDVRMYPQGGTALGKFKANVVHASGNVVLGQNATGYPSQICPNNPPSFCAMNGIKSALTNAPFIVTAKGYALSSVSGAGLPSFSPSQGVQGFSPSAWGAGWATVNGLPYSFLLTTQPTIFVVPGCTQYVVSGTILLQHDVTLVSPCGGFRLNAPNLSGSGSLRLFVQSTSCARPSTDVEISGTNAQAGPKVAVFTPCTLVLDGSTSTTDLQMVIDAGAVVFKGPATFSSLLGVKITAISLSTPGTTAQFLPTVLAVREIPTP